MQRFPRLMVKEETGAVYLVLSTNGGYAGTCVGHTTDPALPSSTPLGAFRSSLKESELKDFHGFVRLSNEE